MKNLTFKLALCALIATASSNMFAAADIYVPFSAQQSNEQLYNYDQSAQDNNMLPRPADENLNQGINYTQTYDNAGTNDNNANSNFDYSNSSDVNQTPKPESDKSDYTKFVDGMGG